MSALVWLHFFDPETGIAIDGDSEDSRMGGTDHCANRFPFDLVAEPVVI